MKLCPKCGVTKPAESFYPHKTTKSGLSSYCRECAKAHAAAYLVANRAAVMATKAKYQKAHRDPLEQRAKTKAWKRANPLQVRAQKALRRARLKNAQGRYTGQDVKRLFTTQRGHCAACRSKLTEYHVDHIIPLAASGSNSPDNLQLLCPPCNISKGAKHPAEFMRERGFLL